MTINQIINVLIEEKNRRIKAICSDYFCDNECIRKNCNKINNAIKELNK